MRGFRVQHVAISWLVMLVLVTAGCTTATFYKSETLLRPDASTDIVVLAPDIELSEFTAGGVIKPNAEWTQKAYQHGVAAIREELQSMGVNAKLVEFELDELDREDAVVQLTKLHGVVGSAVTTHYFTPEFRLPHKNGKFDWTLGDEARVIGSRYDADYALFLFIRDSYTSVGRGVLIFAAALFGVGLQGGQQVGYASLVDLNSGDIVWFNFLKEGRQGDLRDMEGARKTIDGLLKDFPT